MARRHPAWQTALLVVGSVSAIFATGLFAGRMLENYDRNIGFQQEAQRIAEVLQVKPGMAIGDVRAGRGRWTVDLARRVGDEGIVYATAGPRPVHELFKTVAESGVNNVSVITRTPGNNSRLPLGCCDAILLRHVYNDFEDRPGLAARLLKNLKPGGRLALISRMDTPNPGMPTFRVSMQQALLEITSAGFELERSIEDWSATSFCLVFRRPVEDVILTDP
jgi:predicted methyltransferase